MEGTWQPNYMQALQRLKDEINRELDRAQVGAAVPNTDPLTNAFVNAISKRGQ